MTTSIAETQETAQVTATAQEPKATTKANAAPRKPRVTPAKGQGEQEDHLRKEGRQIAKKRQVGEGRGCP